MKKAIEYLLTLVCLSVFVGAVFDNPVYPINMIILGNESCSAETDPIYSAWDKDYYDLSNLPTIPNNCSVDMSCAPITYDSELAYINNCSLDNSCSLITYDSELAYISNCSAEGSCNLITYDTELSGYQTKLDNSSNIIIEGSKIEYNGTGGDNLGNHIATQNLSISNKSITNSDETSQIYFDEDGCFVIEIDGR